MGRVLFLVWCGRVAGRAPFRLSRVFSYFVAGSCLFVFVCRVFFRVVGGLGGVL